LKSISDESGFAGWWVALSVGDVGDNGSRSGLKSGSDEASQPVGALRCQLAFSLVS